MIRWTRTADGQSVLGWQVVEVSGCRQSSRNGLIRDSSNSETTEKASSLAIYSASWRGRLRTWSEQGSKLSSPPRGVGVRVQPDHAEADFVAAIYDVAAEPGGWTACLQMVANAVGAFSSFAHDTPSKRGDASHSSFDESMRQHMPSTSPDAISSADTARSRISIRVADGSMPHVGSALGDGKRYIFLHVTASRRAGHHHKARPTGSTREHRSG